MNCNEKVKVQTKFGITGEVIVNDSLTQGKPLLGPEFACFIDDLKCQLLAKDLGTRYLYLTFASLLFMDDISAIAENEQELIKMLQVIDNFLSKWQLNVNQNKSGIIVFNEKYNVNRKKENLKINIGNKVLESKNSCKYLGEISTPNLKVETHLQVKEIQINGVIQSCDFASSNEVLSQIKMETLLKLYYSCVIPALLYGCETWILNSPEIKHLNRIQINTLRKTLKLSTSTLIPVIYSEIGEIPIQYGN